MTEEQKRQHQKLERLLRKRASAPSVALEAEIKAVAEQIARLEAIRQKATEPVIGEGFAEWVETPTPLADPPGAAPLVVDLRGGKTIADYRREGDPRVARWPPDAA
jgi:hypothetical protein